MSETQKIVEVAKRLLRKDIDLIEASRTFVSLQSKCELRDDEDLKVFWVIESETDHLPARNQFGNRSPENILKLEEEMAEIEEFYAEVVKKSCLNLINRFGDK